MAHNLNVVAVGRRFRLSWGRSRPVPDDTADNPLLPQTQLSKTDQENSIADRQSNDDAFAQAKDEFLQKLPDHERQCFAVCSSAADLRKEMQTVLTHAAEFQHRQTTSRVLQRIQALSDRLEPYFAVVSIVVSSNPEYAAIVWGAIRLVLLLGRNFGEFFDKLAITIERITAKFPQYSALLHHAKLLDSASVAFKNSIRAIYKDTLEFFSSAVRIFVDEKGDKRNALAVAGSLAWKPFDKRFQNILERMEMHQEVLHDEIILLGLARVDLWQKMHAQERQRQILRDHQSSQRQVATDQAMRELQTEAKRAAFVRLKEWLNPPNFMEPLEEAQLCCEDGTAFWLFERPEFIRWRSSRDSPHRAGKGVDMSPMLWVKGPIGSGKTTLAGSAVRELRSLPLTTDGEQPTLCYHFFSRNKFADKSLFAVQSILAQILQQRRWDTSILDVFSFASIDEADGQLTASMLEMLILLRVCLHHLGETYILLDGLDECEDPDGFLSQLLHASSGSNVRFLFFSRPTVQFLLQNVPQSNCVNMDKEFVGPDIRRFLNRRLQRMADEGLFAPHKDGSLFVEQLLNGSDGMFLWAKLMLNYLQSPALTPHERLETIQTVTRPERLDEMYQRIISALQSSSISVRKLATRIFSWLLYCRSELTVDELHEAVTSNGSSSVSSKYPNFDHTLVLTCHGLVALSPTRVCQFVHLSIRDFLRDCGKSWGATGDPTHLTTGTPLIPVEFDGHMEILRCCIDYMTFQDLVQPVLAALPRTSSRDSVAEIVAGRLSLIRYCSLNWTHHLSSITEMLQELSNNKTRRIREVVSVISRLVASQPSLTSWLELLYLFGLEAPPVAKLREWSAYVSRTCSGIEHHDLEEHAQMISELAADLESIHNVWGQILPKKPHLVWGDLTAYTPSKFLWRTNEAHLSTLRPEKPQRASTAAAPLKTISRVSLDGTKVGVLSIWPSREFQALIQDEQFVPKNHINDLGKSVCSGWLAKFEVWTASTSPSLVHQFSITLSENEVRRQLCQSLCKNLLADGSEQRPKGWMIQFPMIIGADLSALVVLRTLFLMHKEGVSDGAVDSGFLRITVPIPSSEHWGDNNCTTDQCPTGRTWGALKAAYHSLYRYAFFLSPDNRFLAFTGHGYFRAYEPSTTCLYWLTPHHPTTKIHLLPPIELHLATIREGRLAFHPRLPLAACLADEGHSYIFTFNLEKVTLITTDDQFSAFYYPKHEVGASGHSTVHFSDCGTQIGIASAASSIPTVINLPGTNIYEAASRNDTVFRPNDRHTTTSTSAGALVATSQQVALPPRTMATQIRFAAWLEEMNENAFNAYRDRMSSGSGRPGLSSIRSISVSPDGAVVSQVLTNLPRWGDLDARSVRVLPSTDEGKITLVLNKTAERWVKLGGDDKARALQANLPAVLTKDVRALEPVQKLEPPAGHPMLGGGSGYTNGTEAGDGDAESQSRIVELE